MYHVPEHPRPGKPKRIGKSGGGLKGSFVQVAFNSHLWQSFSGILVDVGGIEPKWSMFKPSIDEAAAESQGLRVIAALRDGNHQTLWWTPVVRKAVQLKKDGGRSILRNS